MSIADRSILACWGVRGGRAGRPFQVTIDPGGPHEREVDALADAEPVRAGEVIRIRTTGGGGWGDPLDRDPALVVRDVVWRKVSPEAALADYGVVLDRLAGRRRPRLRRRRDARPSGPGGRGEDEAFFDRGPGYARLSGGRHLRRGGPPVTRDDTEIRRRHGAGRRAARGAHLGDRLARRPSRPRPRGARRDAHARVLRPTRAAARVADTHGRRRRR